MEPLISVQLFDHVPSCQPGGTLRCDYQIDAVEEGDVQAVEASVLWYTEGKGDEDMAVHYFERHVAGTGSEGDLRQLRSFSVELPLSPWSYQGEILEVHWCVRVRVFLRHGRSVSLDYPFWLGVRQPSGREAEQTVNG
jgi:hypothetical protein